MRGRKINFHGEGHREMAKAATKTVVIRASQFCQCDDRRDDNCVATRKT